MKSDYEKDKIRKFMIETDWEENYITPESMYDVSRLLSYNAWSIRYELKPLKEFILKWSEKLWNLILLK